MAVRFDGANFVLFQTSEYFYVPVGEKSHFVSKRYVRSSKTSEIVTHVRPPMGCDRAKKRCELDNSTRNLEVHIRAMAKAHSEMAKTMAATCRRLDVLLACLANKVSPAISRQLDTVINVYGFIVFDKCSSFSSLTTMHRTL